MRVDLKVPLLPQEARHRNNDSHATSIVELNKNRTLYFVYMSSYHSYHPRRITTMYIHYESSMVSICLDTHKRAHVCTLLIHVNTNETRTIQPFSCNFFAKLLSERIRLVAYF